MARVGLPLLEEVLLGASWPNDKLLDVVEVIGLLTALLEKAAGAEGTEGQPPSSALFNVPLSVDLVLNWLLNVYDRCVVIVVFTNLRIACISLVLNIILVVIK